MSRNFSTPSKRNGANVKTQHEMFWTKKEWMNDTSRAAQVRMMSAFVVNDVVRWKHDMLHSRIEPIHVPIKPVLDTIYEFGLLEPAGKPMDRIEGIVNRLAQEAIHETSYEQSDQLIEVAYHLNAQRSILTL